MLLDEYIRPIVMIARAQIELGSDVGLPAGLRMPKLPLGPTKLIAVCDGMIDAVVRASFRGDLVTLTAWRGAKRVQQTGGGAGGRGAVDVPEALIAA